MTVIDVLFLDGTHKEPGEARSTIPAACLANLEARFGGQIEFGSEDFRGIAPGAQGAGTWEEILVPHLRADGIVVFGMPAHVVECHEAWSALRERFPEVGQKPFVTAVPHLDGDPAAVVDVSDTETNHDYGDGSTMVLAAIERDPANPSLVRATWEPIHIPEGSATED